MTIQTKRRLLYRTVISFLVIFSFVTVTLYLHLESRHHDLNHEEDSETLLWEENEEAKKF
ncbi:hypothetical protein ACERII_19655 [Evansella sp. AB-rgal1]|uniref:hypothetical protein n=1 Tax=Evansella sp. AB-rgal1 TaxID=3242696 RepID=UPI00359DA461